MGGRREARDVDVGGRFLPAKSRSTILTPRYGGSSLRTIDGQGIAATY